MMSLTERKLYAVPPQLLTSDGTKNGQLTVDNASLYIVGQIILIQSSTKDSISVKINRISNINTIDVGPVGQDVARRIDISMFTVLDGAFIFANEQNRPPIPEEKIERATYDDEPIVARRTILVDKMGERIDETNPLPVVVSSEGGGVKTPLITNLSMPLQNTEYCITLPSTTKRFIMKSRGQMRAQLSYVAGMTNINFLSLPFGFVYMEEGLVLNAPLKIYVRSNKDAQMIEVVSWS